MFMKKRALSRIYESFINTNDGIFKQLCMKWLIYPIDSI